MNLVKNIVNKYKQLTIYVIVAGFCFFIDQLIFNFTLYLFKLNTYILISKLIARTISSLLNYFLNSNVVFKNKNKNSIFKYFALVIFQAFISGISVYLVKMILDNLDVTIISIIVDIVIFVANYIIQKKWVFKCQ